MIKKSPNKTSTMTTSPKLKCILEKLIRELADEINYLLTTNITTDGKSLLYSLAYWAKRVMFNDEYNYDTTAYDYLGYLYEDVRVLLLRFYYYEGYADHLNN
ncbi:hypothetical protein EDI_232740 [Entamoeba dispar SAW760]|uniref:Uncharacterized protein n=1 Tax=Entamoeba dispar (strain ATCC PRA-260 / SAW760) TaxID=370354 RepID=B0EPT8_ENTDS|nr:uncharacterized protein EDI_232740 [Entamoeba dispar SAW760]EDR23462.1 hypothetical protein EDI_232740 [Entamoeba dispar SAW760]|eukprot:EDR23462.1 hypothetical protein EDI_232740 [Entamoeba dispar SAW760]